MNEKKYKYKYIVLDHTDDPKDAMSFNSLWSDEYAEYVAEDAAEYHHGYHNGYEDEWPLEFRVWDESGSKLGDFLVERRSEPVFSAESIST